MIKVVFLAVLQGVAEFLPVSSSGHLVVGQSLLGINEPGMRLDLMLHVGTLFSVAAFYRKAIWRIISRFEWKYVLSIAASAVPAAVAYFAFKDFVDGAFEDAKTVGALLMFTGAILLGTRYMPRGSRDVSLPRALAMGIGQAVAILPGVSRSGMTIACARAANVDPEKAAEFSFLMSAPPILGGMLLDLVKDAPAAETAADAQISWYFLILGAAVAAVVGYFSLALLLKALKGKWFWMFGPYCIVVGLAVLVFL